MIRNHVLPVLLALAAGCTLTLDPSQYAPKSAADCGTSQKVCGYKCVPMDDPATGCGGASCAPCPSGAHAAALCGDGGACAIQCDLGWGDCDGAPTNGCELPLDGSMAYCGGCSRTCAFGTNCVAPGFCKPNLKSVSSTPAGIYADPTGVAPRPVYYTTADGTGTVWKTDESLTSNTPVWSGIGNVSCVYGDGNQALVCRDGPGSAELWRIAPPLPAPTGTATVIGSGNLVPGAPARLAVSMATPLKAWWITPGGDDLRVIPLDGSPPSAPYALPKVGSFRAVAWELYQGIFVADDDQNGRVRNLDLNPALTFVQPVGTGFGSIGAVAARFTISTQPDEVYVADLATGSVYRQQGTSRRAIWAGSGPTPLMEMVADAKGVFWTNSAAGTVLEYDPLRGQIVTRNVGGSPAHLTITPDWVIWTDAVSKDVSAVAR